MIRLLVTLGCVFLFACAPSGPHKPVSEAGGGGAGEFSTSGYESVKPIFAKYCSACHPSRSGPDWLDYPQANNSARTGKLLRRVGVERSMPPPGTSQAASLSETERLALVDWAKAGGPREPVQQRGGGPAPVATEREPSARERLISNCLHCHGASGPDPSAQPRIPVITGQSEKYLIEQLLQFKRRERIDPTAQMNDVTVDLSVQQITEAAQYFASREAQVASGLLKMTDEELKLYERGEAIAKRDCVSCHRNPEYGNRPTDPLVPALSGQSRVYLINQLLYFRSGERTNPLMAPLAKELRFEDIDALATYFANVR